MQKNDLSKSTLNRLPIYLGYLRSLSQTSCTHVSATGIATALGLGEVQVRKDLASISCAGRPKIGYEVSALIDDLENFLGFRKISDAVIVGAGKLGRALLDYDGFCEYGLNIAAAFDTDKSVIGISEGKKPVLELSQLTEFCTSHGIKIGIIAVPAKHAYEVCELMVKSGIKRILNFAPVHLIESGGVIIKNENIATSLALLSKDL